MNFRRWSVEDGNRVATILPVAVDVGNLGTQEPIGLLPEGSTS